MTEYQPYGGARPAQSHSPTSQAAAASIQRRVGPLHAKILSYLCAVPAGATDEEMQSGLNMAANTQRPRRRELELVGLVKDSGTVKRTQSGRNAVVWVLT